MTIVNSVEEMTADWFTAALADVLGDARVTAVSTEQLGGGAFARMIRASLSYDGETTAPASVIVKIPSTDPGSFGMAKAMGMYDLEVSFYRDVAPLVPGMSIPTCYLGESDPTSGLFTLVMADLTGVAAPIPNVGAGSTVEEMLEACRAAITELVAFQAPLWNSPQVEKLAWLADPARAIGMFEAMGQGLEPFVARFGDSLDAEHIEFFRANLPRAGEWVRSWGRPTVVQHGDFRSDNLMRGTAPGAPAITVIDFQTVRLGPPGIDLAYLIGSSLPTEDRRVQEKALVADYHAQLVGAGVEDFDADACWNAYREGALYGAFLFVGLAAQVVSTPEIDAYIAAQAKRYADMAIDLDSAALLKGSS
ncbi:hypothetical protein GCM10009547_19740 [Sporichthya brevicatena]|uniref:CHK kinase-like domain-containing protein n=1 Tax=Sporichthya brevicatena TaxID=171442 RepID=A0ABN1GRP9_9ACTN